MVAQITPSHRAFTASVPKFCPNSGSTNIKQYDVCGKPKLRHKLSRTLEKYRLCIMLIFEDENTFKHLKVGGHRTKLKEIPEMSLRESSLVSIASGVIPGYSSNLDLLGKEEILLNFSHRWILIAG